MIVKRRERESQKEFAKPFIGRGPTPFRRNNKFGGTNGAGGRKSLQSKPKVDVTRNNKITLGQAPSTTNSVSVMSNPTPGFDLSGAKFNPPAVKPQTVTPSTTIQPKPAVDSKKLEAFNIEAKADAQLAAIKSAPKPIASPTNPVQSPILQSAGPTKPIIDLPLPGLAQPPVNNTILGPVQVNPSMSTKTVTPTVVKSKPVEVTPSTSGSSTTTTTTTNTTGNSNNSNKGWLGQEIRKEGKRLGRLAGGTMAGIGAAGLAVPLIAANSEYGIHDV